MCIYIYKIYGRKKGPYISHFHTLILIMVSFAWFLSVKVLELKL